MYKRIFLFILLAIVAAIISFVAFADRSLGFQFALATTLIAAVFQLGAVYLFLTSLRTFQRRLKIAYGVLSLGIFLVTVAQLQLLFVSIYSLFNSPWVNNGGTLYPYIIALAALYTGIYLFARSLQINYFWAKLRYVIPISLVVAAAFAFLLPNNFRAERPQLEFMIYVGTLGIAVVDGLSAMLVARRIKGSLGIKYQPAMNALVIFFGLSIFAALHETVTTTLSGLYGPYLNFSLWPLDLSALAVLVAAIRFREQSKTSLSPEATYPEIIAYAASMVSKPAAIKPLLDKMTTITSKLAPGKPLSEQDKTLLVYVYLQIEDYLVEQEIVRKLSRKDIRAALPQEFRDRVTAKKDRSAWARIFGSMSLL